MTDQFTQPKDIIRRLTSTLIAIVVITLVLIVGWCLHETSKPYVQEVLSLKGDMNKGRAIFEINCAGCHSLQADGSVGPSLHHVHKHKSKIKLINQVISVKTQPLPKFKSSPQEMADLLSYLEYL
ncbi:cytochrome c class I [cyanobacterium endosymbiont of Rhopalodia gibberula]|uniref:c-type cytochrome n=1 Tax=cyanobacterium endosymbiont of Rhopalodia gibberula TaxID=1763363 RepID=UPI000DC72C11|nr:cytochrome c [cyanobacterium endosymbiont of Rhopalodia gibberula]BBA79167.1 cytochrome c class I [cyanobacterium endosymbiont of Rhopalodia gibberula]